jgi:putative membrane protein
MADRERGRGGWTGGRIVAVVLVVVAVIFFVQNRESVRVDWLFLNVTMPLWLTLAIVFVLGGVVGWLMGRRK